MATPDKSSARFREATPTPSVRNRSTRAKPLQLALAEVPQVEPSPGPAISLEKLWLAVYLPRLPLEAVLETTAPSAVFEDQQGIRKVLLADSKARRSGIGPGLSVNAALALVPTLQLEARDRQREAAVLRELAEWSEQYTSFTCIEPPSLLLLEIAGSLNLFGGIRMLRERISRELEQQGFHAAIAIAPTPLAATWLARAGQRACIRDPRNLVGRLGRLPLSCLGWPEATLSALRGMGVATVGEVLRLPRQGFVKRFGAMCLVELDRALGKLPDPRVGYRAPERFIADFDLDEEQDDAALLLNACRELLVRLERFLVTRQLALQQIAFSFFHLQIPATHLDLGCVQADRAMRHWFDLLEIRFERLELPAPVIAVRLCGGHGQQFAAVTENLPFRQKENNRQYTSIAHLTERLSARMGDETVHGVMAVAEHRPQYAWRARSTGEESPCCAGSAGMTMDPHAPGLLADIRRSNSLILRRPLWVLEEPRLLEVLHEVPRYGGPLKLLDGPERLETGWWDDDGIARDYYVAMNPRGVHLWIFRDRGRGGHWYLHGMFG